MAHKESIFMLFKGTSCVNRHVFLFSDVKSFPI